MSGPRFAGPSDGVLDADEHDLVELDEDILV